MSNKIKKCYWGNLGVEQNKKMYYKNVEQIQEVYVEQNQVDMSNKMRFSLMCSTIVKTNARKQQQKQQHYDYHKGSYFHS